MKIAQVIHGFPPYSMGGSELYTYNLSRELAKQDEVFVFYRIADSNRPEYDMHFTTSNGLNLYAINNTLKSYDSFEKTYKNDSISKIFAYFLEEIKPDIVHFQHLMCLSTTLIEEAKKRRIPVIFTLHDFWLFCHLGQLLKLDLSICHGPQDSECARCQPPRLVTNGTLNKALNIMRRSGVIFTNKALQRVLLKAFHQHYGKICYFLQRKRNVQMRKRNIHIKEMCSLVDLFISPSNFLRSKFEDFGIRKNKIIYYPNGFDLELFSSFSKKKSQKIRFGYIGMFIPSKGIHILLDAFNNIQARDVELRIHGAPQSYHQGFIDYPAYLRSLGKRDNILWFGEYDNNDIARILSEIDVLLVPSIWYENAPLTIHEAFMASVPVITSNIGGMAEFVHDGENGLLFQVGDSSDLTAKMQMIIDDPDLVNKLQRGIKSVTPIDEHVENIRKFYRGLL
ncbi:MAG: glycosyltransferase family 4 protein [Candidatus Hodarchaeota archaeon]